jgi:hypothetical protein
LRAFILRQLKVFKRLIAISARPALYRAIQNDITGIKVRYIQSLDAD